MSAFAVASDAKRTSAAAPHMSASDPKRTQVRRFVEQSVALLVKPICQKTQLQLVPSMALAEQYPRSVSYRNRAEECRVIAQGLHGSETQQKLLKIAEEYERMAERAAAFELQQADLDDAAKAIGKLG